MAFPMDYRCPVCGANLAKRKLTQAIVARMEIDCSHCGRKIRLNVHLAEEITVLAGFGSFVALATVAYSTQSQALGLAAFAVAMLTALALPLLEKTYLRAWPRYSATEQASR
jgi:DNA-directed RNA polymerase subunit RPC12/RpoP